MFVNIHQVVLTAIITFILPDQWWGRLQPTNDLWPYFGHALIVNDTCLYAWWSLPLVNETSQLGITFYLWSSNMNVIIASNVVVGTFCWLSCVKVVCHIGTEGVVESSYHGHWADTDVHERWSRCYRKFSTQNRQIPWRRTRTCIDVLASLTWLWSVSVAWLAPAYMSSLASLLKNRLVSKLSWLFQYYLLSYSDKLVKCCLSVYLSVCFFLNVNQIGANCNHCTSAHRVICWNMRVASVSGKSGCVL